MLITRSALSRAIATLSHVNDVPEFLVRLFVEGLTDAGSAFGMVVMLADDRRPATTLPIGVLLDGRPVDVGSEEGQPADWIVEGRLIQDFIGQVALHVEGVATPLVDAPYAAEHRAKLHAAGIQSIHSIGMWVGPLLTGWISAGYRDAASPARPQVALLSSLAEQMTMAIQLSRMAEHSRQAAIALERENSARSRTERIMAGSRILTGAIETLTTEPVVDAMFKYTLRSICEQHYGPDSLGSLWFVDVERGVSRRHLLFSEGKVIPSVNSGFPFEGKDQPLRLLRQEAFIGNSPLHRALTDLPGEQADFLRAKGVRGLVFFPMSLAGKLIGVFALCLPEGRPDPNQEDLHITQTLAQQATLAIRLTQLAEEARSAAVVRERERAAQTRVDELVRANGALKRSLDLIAGDTEIDNTYGRLLQVVAEQVDCRASTLCLRDETTDTFNVERCMADGVSSSMPSLGLSARLCPPPSSQFWQLLVQKCGTLVVEQDAIEPGSDLDEWFAEFGGRSLTAVPLLLRGSVIGCFTFKFEEPGPLSIEQIELLQTLAHQATLSVQLERLARAMQSKSFRAATLAERARIARDLHDTLAQGLTGILMHLHASERSDDWLRSKKHVHAALEVTRNSLVDARRAVYALRSLSTERPAFTAALRAILKATFAGSHVAVEVSGRAQLGSVDETAESELLRIAQEAATNALKHARASRFFASVAENDEEVIIEFGDDGVGFDPELPMEGFGLVGMRERAARIGATIAVESAVGAGTRVVATLPCKVT